MVGHPALREVVGADALGAVAAADHRLPRLGLGAMRLAAHLLVDARAQHIHRLGAVAVLAALVLHGDDDTRRQVSQAHRGIGLVDVLPARAGRAVDVDPQILVVDLHLDFARLGQHGDRRRRGMDAPAAFGHRHALHEVHAALELQFGEHPGAVDLGDDLLEPAEVVGVQADRLDLPALLGGIALVHAEQVRREQRRFVAAGAGADFEHRRARIGAVARQHGDREAVLGLGQLAAQLGQLLVGQRLHLRILAQRRQLGDLGAHLAHLARRLRHRLQLGIIAAGGDEFVRRQRARSEPSLEFGIAVGDLSEALFRDGHTDSGGSSA